jgi:hypothetical protein
MNSERGSPDNVGLDKILLITLIHRYAVKRARVPEPLAHLSKTRSLNSIASRPHRGALRRAFWSKYTRAMDYQLFPTRKRPIPAQNQTVVSQAHYYTGFPYWLPIPAH